MSELVTLPKGWVETELDCISQITTGNPAPQGEQFFENGKFLFVRVKDMGQLKNNIFITQTNDKVNEIAIKNLKLFPKGSILFTKSGASLLLNQRAILKQNSYVVSHIGISIPIGDIPSKWIYYFLLITDFANYSHATNLPSIKLSDISKFNIPLPPLNEQKRIVAKIEELFSELDHTKDTLQKVKLQLVQYRQSLLKSAFEGKLTEEWRERNMPKLHADWSDYISQRKSIEKIAKKNFDNFVTIPDNYCWVNFKIISNSMKNGIYKEKKFYSENGIVCLRMYNIENNKIVWKKIKRMNLTSEEIKEFQLLPNDILFNRVNSLELVGKSALITEGLEDCVYESKNIRLRLDMKKINPKFVHFWLIIAGSHYFYNNFQQTTGMASVNQTQLGELPIPYCTIEEQQEIVTQIELGFSLIENTESITNTMLKQLETLRSSILKQAFDGKLVPQDPNDEPAEKLLQRIKEQKSRGKK